jgi:hypothetical protein
MDSLDMFIKSAVTPLERNLRCHLRCPKTLLKLSLGNPFSLNGFLVPLRSIPCRSLMPFFALCQPGHTKDRVLPLLRGHSTRHSLRSTQSRHSARGNAVYRGTPIVVRLSRCIQRCITCICKFLLCNRMTSNIFGSSADDISSESSGPPTGSKVPTLTWLSCAH